MAEQTVPASGLPVVSQVVALALACAVLLIVPGPSVLFVVGRTLSHGKRVAFFSEIGNGAGCYADAVLVSFGLGALIERFGQLLLVIKIAGALYLVWLGIRAIRAETPSVAEPGQKPSVLRSFREGFLVGVTNPKAYIIFAAIVPQFLRPSAGSPVVQLLVLGLVPCVLGVLSDLGWVLVAGAARRWLSGSARRMRNVGRAGGAMLVGLAVSLLLGSARSA
jgi:threonine/homoserine/homoserine lactone efflux protein